MLIKKEILILNKHCFYYFVFLNFFIHLGNNQTFMHLFFKKTKGYFKALCFINFFVVSYPYFKTKDFRNLELMS